MSSGASAGHMAAMVVTLGGSGMSPVAPGTFGSLAAVVVLGAIFFGMRGALRRLTPAVWNVILARASLYMGRSASRWANGRPNIMAEKTPAHAFWMKARASV